MDQTGPEVVAKVRSGESWSSIPIDGGRGKNFVVYSSILGWDKSASDLGIVIFSDDEENKIDKEERQYAHEYMAQCNETPWDKDSM